MSELTILKNGNLIGSITWNEPEKEDDRTTLKLKFLDVRPEFQSKGYGNFLIICMLSTLGIRGPLEITLDDCSDLARTKNCLYYKIGFRMTNPDDEEPMSAYIKCNTTSPSFVYPDNLPETVPVFNSLEEFTQQIKNKIDETDLTFKLKKFKWNGNGYDTISDDDITPRMYQRLSILNIINYNERSCKSSFGKRDFKRKLKNLKNDIKYLKKLRYFKIFI